ncbi:uncharacterized protein LOC126745297 [Anthonomus grandis grandis]|uniref:uncharacterized protein LOC126745297 n=1 Tax=Anthonomus grandis grandis TaxID=2921223 RepID=UPI002165BC12|nr:uncharacterized protein LOC126745297 [Anthonomus grandis grandis]
MTQNRKRCRSFQDETEFMPLSKRINNLHINNMMTESGCAEWSQNRISDSPTGSEQSSEYNYSSQYSPDLNESQNPHYFNINKLLYEMYLERMNRGCHQI